MNEAGVIPPRLPRTEVTPQLLLAAMLPMFEPLPSVGLGDEHSLDSARLLAAFAIPALIVLLT